MALLATGGKAYFQWKRGDAGWKATVASAAPGVLLGKFNFLWVLGELVQENSKRQGFRWVGIRYRQNRGERH